jgi:CheY-like chemotaxis protein
MASVLIAEDDRLIAFVMIEVLERAGHRVLHADDGAQAIAILQKPEHAIDIVVIDLVMPGVDGAHLLAYCREQYPQLPMIMTSGYTEEFVQMRLRGLRPDAFLSKPWRVELLIETVDRLLAH